MKKITFFLMLILLGGAPLMAQPPLITVAPNSGEFSRAVMDHPYVVAFFYEPTTDKGYRDMVTFLSAERLYKDARLHFIFASTGNYDLKQLAYSYDVDQFPGFILFDHGRIVKDSDGSNAVIEGYVTQTDIKKFINHHFGQALIKRARQRPRVRVVERRYRSRPSGYFSFGGGPYYGGYGGPWGGPWGYPGYGGAGFGFSIGF